MARFGSASAGVATQIVPALLTLGPGDLHAQGSAEAPLVTDRPDFTESTVTVAPGRFQLESGHTFAKLGRTEAHTIGEVLVRVGLVERVEARIGLNSYTVAGSPDGAPDGAEDLSLGFKWTLAARDAGTRRGEPDVALLVEADLPTGAEKIGGDGVRPSAILALSWPLSERFDFGMNGGLEYASGGGERFARASGSATAAFSLAEGLGVFAEVFALFPEEKGGPDTHFINAGLTLLAGPDLQFDGRIGVGLDQPDPNYFAGVGLAWRH